MIVLGLNAFHGDASAALFVDGELAYAIEEERLNRQKHSGGFPKLAVRACLELAGVRPEQINHVAVSRDPRAQIARKLYYLGQRAARLPMSSSDERSALFGALQQRLTNRQRLSKTFTALAAALDVAPASLRAQLHQVEHHRAHLASAFFPSPFDEAAVLSLDGFGDFVSTMWGVGRDRRIEVEGHVGFPHSLGVLYTAVCQWLGFSKYGDEGKIMGLSAYGKPSLLHRMRALIHLTDDGFALALRYFRHHREGVDMTFADGTPALGRLYSPALCELLGAPRPPGPGVEREPYFCDVAASLQALLEEAVLHICKNLAARTRLSRLCLAGGVALNCVANGRILDESGFSEVFIQPAAGDNGTALGAALWVSNQVLRQPRRFVMDHAYTGPSFDEAACRAAIDAALLSGEATREQFSVEKLTEIECVTRAAADLDGGAVLGWFQGRMELGPRALGHRSILADPRRAEMKDILNRRIKHREPFRPFAPSVLEEETASWFVRGAPAPSMLLVDKVRPEKRAQVPAITHEDGTARLQTVSAKSSSLYHALLRAFFARTGVPMLLNTSFNEHEPIVCTPQDALRCFLKTQMDVLCLGPFYLTRRGFARSSRRAF